VICQFYFVLGSTTIFISEQDARHAIHVSSSRDAGTGGGGDRRGSRPRCPLSGGARGEKVPFQFKGLTWRNSELSEMLAQFFYEFASENARNVVIELQE
jgi:hypothetical protein